MEMIATSGYQLSNTRDCFLH
jgi:pyruvate dehydrogenase E1 component beta subunit